MKKKLVLVLLLGGCASEPMTEYERYAAEQQRQQYVDQQFRSNCSRYGFQPGTPEFAQCVQQQYSERNAAAQQRQGERRALQRCAMLGVDCNQ